MSEAQKAEHESRHLRRKRSGAGSKQGDQISRRKDNKSPWHFEMGCESLDAASYADHGWMRAPYLQRRSWKGVVSCFTYQSQRASSRRLGTGLAPKMVAQWIGKRHSKMGCVWFDSLMKLRFCAAQKRATTANKSSLCKIATRKIAEKKETRLFETVADQHRKRTSLGEA